MQTARLWLGLTLLLALPLQADAQEHRRDQHRGLTGAVEKLFEHREQLGMSSEQLARVQAIKDNADSRKQPHWQQIMTIRRALKARRNDEPDMPRAEREALIKDSGDKVEALLDQIREIDHAAMREVGAVLTQQQKEMIREMVSRDRDDRDGSGERARPRD